jgi:hypothetical protein
MSSALADLSVAYRAWLREASGDRINWLNGSRSTVGAPIDIELYEGSLPQIAAIVMVIEKARFS